MFYAPLTEAFQHTAARRRLGQCARVGGSSESFNTQPPEGGWFMTRTTLLEYVSVSTHSRPKAAGVHFLRLPNSDYVFQHTAARRRLVSVSRCSPSMY